MNMDDMVEEASKNAQGKDQFIFKHKEKFGKEVFETIQKVDVLGYDDDEMALTKVFQGFFRFLAECGWDPEEVLYKMSDMVYQAEEVLIKDRFDEDPLTKIDPAYKLFLQKLGEGEPSFLKEVYDSHRGLQSLN